jgi:transposase
MTMPRRQHRGAFKAKVVLEALRGERTLHEMAADYGVHPLQMTPWQQVALAGVPTRLSGRRGPKQKEEEALKAALDQQIGQVKVALDWLQKQVGHVR